MLETKQRYKSDFINNKNIKIIFFLAILLTALLLFAFFRDRDTLITNRQANILYTNNKIEKLILDGPYIHIKTATNRYKIYKNAINKTAFFEKYPVYVVENNSNFYDFLSFIIILITLGLLFRFLKENRDIQMKQFESANNNMDTNVETTSIKPIISNITFNDVAGIKDVKEELEEIIDFLRNPKKYHKLGIRLPKGVLLSGPPGVGKTLISKAVAGEANVPFFYQSGASFVHIYVGIGAKRVSELFQKAKQNAPSIVFIDEIDAVGKSRGEFRNDEREATLNQLLTEMDGFEDSSGVIVIGATNKIEMLDDALLRAGRFDRRIHISLPDLEDREKILKLYLKYKPHNVNIEDIAHMTVGFNSSALSTLINEATIYAMRNKRASVTTSDFEAVKEKVIFGKHKILSFTDEEREIQSIYQGAKAVIATWLDVEFDKIGIVNSHLNIQEQEILSKTALLSQIKVLLAGSVATRVRYNEQFTNAVSDISNAKDIAYKVVNEYSMTDSFTPSANEVEEILQESISELNRMLKTLDEALDKVSKYLLLYENITQEKCRDILRAIF